MTTTTPQTSGSSASTSHILPRLGHSEQTIDAVAKAISRFEAYTRYKDFKAFHVEQARGFKRDLSDQRGHSGEPLSKATLYATLTALKRFFAWLAGQPGYKSRVTYADAEYFNLSTKTRALPRRSVRRAFPPWSKFTTWSDGCPRPPISSGGIARW